MLIGILQTGLAPDALVETSGDYPDMFARLLAGNGFDFQTFRVVDGVFPASVQDCDGWLITGSRHGVYEDHAFIPPLEDFIRAAYAAHVPMVGVCFGHQIIAQAMGGRVVKHPEGWRVGAQDYVIGGKPMVLNAWHQDQVVARPAGARVVARSGFCENAALAYGDSILTVQAHPEFDEPVIRGLIEHRGSAVPAPLIAEARHRLEAGEAAGRLSLANRIEEFFKRQHANA